MRTLLPISLLLLSSGCVTNSYDYSRAIFVETERYYEITLNGKIAGHPASFSEWFFPKLFDRSRTIKLPKTFGIIDGNLIPHKKGSYGFVGKVELRKGYVDFDLEVDEYDRDTTEKWWWNGKYKLHREN